MSSNPISFPVSEGDVEALRSVRGRRVRWIPTRAAPPQPQRSPAEQMLLHAQEQTATHFGAIVQRWRGEKLINARQERAILQASAALARTAAAALDLRPANAPVAGIARPASAPSTNQVSLEDLMAALEFVPFPRGISLELLESEIFEEDHLAGPIGERVAYASTERGIEIAAYDETPTSDEERDPADVSEQELLDGWLDRINDASRFNFLVEHTALVYSGEGNAYWEIIRDAWGPNGTPSSIEVFIPSTVRVLSGRRGYVQVTGPDFRWFNPYTPREEDRLAGVALWEDYWGARGWDPYAEQFLRTGMAKTLNADMPAGVWNPLLTEVIHFRSIWPASKYYGFPSWYRLAKLHLLLSSAIDANIQFLRNGRVPPYVLIWHGELDDAAYDDLVAKMATWQGAERYGAAPLIEAPLPPAGGSGAQSNAKTGLEVVYVGGMDEGSFLELWQRVTKDVAAGQSMPYDLLFTDSSNRATVSEALAILDRLRIHKIHEMLEEALQQITKTDMGLERRYVRFVRIDDSDNLQLAQEMTAWIEAGVFNVNDVLSELGRPPRDGGDVYYRAGSISPEPDPNAPEPEALPLAGAAALTAALNGGANAGDITDATNTATGQGAPPANPAGSAVQQRAGPAAGDIHALEQALHDAAARLPPAASPEQEIEEGRKEMADGMRALITRYYHPELSGG